ncbi:MAG: hypothetical protein ABSA97_04930 [Verrucomicrobiia bacterium]
MKTNCAIYVYKMTVDNGGAPCVKYGLLSLAICKPMIRRNAEAESEDLIFGFAANSLDHHNRLIYVARVTEKPEVGDYYRKRRFVHRPDCIYRYVGGRAERRSHAEYHSESDQRRKDVGMRFENAYVLLSRDFRYFGDKGTDSYKRDFPAVAALVKRLKQGHRVNLSPQVRRELLELKKQIWRSCRRMKIGLPMEADRTRLCNSESPSAQC